MATTSAERPVTPPLQDQATESTESGSVTRANVRNADAPKVAEAARKLGSTSAKAAAIGCTAKGRL